MTNSKIKFVLVKKKKKISEKFNEFEFFHKVLHQSNTDWQLKHLLEDTALQHRRARETAMNTDVSRALSSPPSPDTAADWSGARASWDLRPLVEAGSRSRRGRLSHQPSCLKASMGRGSLENALLQRSTHHTPSWWRNKPSGQLQAKIWSEHTPDTWHFLYFSIKKKNNKKTDQKHPKEEH